MANRSIVGDNINFRGLVYAPMNENGVIFLFGKVADDLNMYIEEIKPGFPDCVARRFVGKGWEQVTIEFEYQSSNFEQHKHDASKCDIIVCWEHDWAGCPMEVIELKSEIRSLENYTVEKPGSPGGKHKQIEEAIKKIAKTVQATTKVTTWYEKVYLNVSKISKDIWAKVGKKYIGWYSPERALSP